MLVSGVLDALAREGERALVVDWKSDRLAPGETPAAAAARDYGLQRDVYALALLRAGVAEVEVVHCYLERPETPATARHLAAEAPAIASRLAARAAAILGGELEASAAPWSGLCAGCPGRGTLCPHPRARTERDAPPASVGAETDG